jgi:hypothetical protein
MNAGASKPIPTTISVAPSSSTSNPPSNVLVAIVDYISEVAQITRLAVEVVTHGRVMDVPQRLQFGGRMCTALTAVGMRTTSCVSGL